MSSGGALDCRKKKEKEEEETHDQRRRDSSTKILEGIYGVAVKKACRLEPGRGLGYWGDLRPKMKKSGGGE